MGCYREEKMFKLSLFDECFYGKCGMTDIDGFVEQFGHCLFTEFKCAREEFDGGQRIALERLTLLSQNITVLVVHADAANGDVYGYASVRYGTTSDWTDADIDAVRCVIKEWRESACKTHASLCLSA